MRPEYIQLSSIQAYKELRKAYVIELLKSIGIMLVKIAIDVVCWLACIIIFRTFFLIGILVGYFALKKFIEAVISIKDVVDRFLDVQLVNRSMKR